MERPDTPQKITRGMYRGVRISVSTLNKVIVAGIAVIIILLVYGIATGGYHVTYDSNGGSDVEYQEYKYGDGLELPEPPEREGYRFAGWYADENFNNPVKDGEEIQGNLTLYAKWDQIK